MSFKSGRATDGYILSSTNNTFITPWLDAHSSPFLCLTVCFSSTGTTGTLTVEQSCDKESFWTDGSTIPASAFWQGTYGTGAYGDPIDLQTVPSTTVSVNTTSALVYTPINTNSFGARFFRCKFIASGSTAQTITVTYTWKSAS